jgi:hypothetical protein
MPGRHVRNDRTRVWLMQGGASPFVQPVYEGTAKAGTPRFTRGAGTVVTDPDPDRLGEFIEIDTLPAARSKPQLPLTARYTSELSALLDIVNNGCENDIQVHIGFCQDPKDFNLGWDKILSLESATGDDYGMSGDLGALNESDRAIVDETVTFSGRKLYEIGRINLTEQATTEVEKEVIDITVCDRVICTGQCGRGSDGCQKIYAVEIHGGTSPSSKMNLIFSVDGGANWLTSSVTSAGGTDDPNGIACVGRNVVVISRAGLNLHYADQADLENGDETWTAMAEGFITSHGPNAIFSRGTSQTWIAAQGGYIYFAEDATVEVVVQDAGNGTTENLLAIDGYDENNIVAVGANNAIVATDDGLDWFTVTGPEAGVTLNCVAYKPDGVIIVGTDGGKAWASRDLGNTWRAVTFPGSGTGSVKDIVFASMQVGYMAHTSAGGLGRILRTVNGGASWYVAPEGSGSVPTNDDLNALAVCSNVNRVFAGGINGSDGILVKGA